jgi:hypothetical protein
VITIDYDEDVGDLFVRLRHVEYTEGDVMGDGKAIIHSDRKGKIPAVEITDITAF